VRNIHKELALARDTAGLTAALLVAGAALCTLLAAVHAQLPGAGAGAGATAAMTKSASWLVRLVLAVIGAGRSALHLASCGLVCAGARARHSSHASSQVLLRARRERHHDVDVEVDGEGDEDEDDGDGGIDEGGDHERAAGGGDSSARDEVQLVRRAQVLVARLVAIGKRVRACVRA
jgi:hypothetical protein